MSDFIVSDFKIRTPIFGNPDSRTWTLDAGSLNLDDSETVDLWIASGSAPAPQKTFNLSNAANGWDFPKFDSGSSIDGIKSVSFNGSQRILTQTFTGSNTPNSVIVIANIDGIRLPAAPTSTARLWGSGVVNAPNMAVKGDGSVSLACGSSEISIPYKRKWMAFGASWDSQEMTLSSSDGDLKITSLASIPDQVTRNFVGGNNSGANPNGLVGRVSKIAFWNRRLSPDELFQRMSLLIG